MATYGLLTQTKNDARCGTKSSITLDERLRLRRETSHPGRGVGTKDGAPAVAFRTDKHGWIGNKSWEGFIREVGLNPETMEELDPFRWAVAEEMIFSGEFPKTFPYSVFRERLALAREAALNADCVHNTTESVDESEPSNRRQALEGFGLELH